MNKPLRVGLIIGGVFIVLLAVLIGAGMVHNNTASNNNQSSTTPDSSKPSSVSPAPDTQATTPPAAVAAGSYQEYDAAALKASAAQTRVLFFHAPWCPQCRQLESDITKNGVPQDIAIFKVDYDTNQTLRQKYSVVQQTTVVAVDANGNKLAMFLPYSDPTLKNALAGLGL